MALLKIPSGLRREISERKSHLGPRRISVPADLKRAISKGNMKSLIDPTTGHRAGLGKKLDAYGKKDM